MGGRGSSSKTPAGNRTPVRDMTPSELDAYIDAELASPGIASQLEARQGRVQSASASVRSSLERIRRDPPQYGRSYDLGYGEVSLMPVGDGRWSVDVRAKASDWVGGRTRPAMGKSLGSRKSTTLDKALQLAEERLVREIDRNA